MKKRETTGEVLLRNTETIPDPPTPVPRPRQKNQTADKRFVTLVLAVLDMSMITHTNITMFCHLFSDSESGENSGSVASKDSLDSKQNVWSKPRSDTESVGNANISSSKTETETGHVISEQPR